MEEGTARVHAFYDNIYGAGWSKRRSEQMKAFMAQW